MKKLNLFVISLLTIVFILLISCTKIEIVYVKPIDSSIVDIDGNNYTKKTIGYQIWMVENLKTTTFNDGTPIPFVNNAEIWSTSITPAYTECNGNIINSETYGKLYNWHAVNTGKLCPTGWHVPSYNEWMQLADYLGGDSIAGGKLKEAGFEHWEEPNVGATNESGFTALPGGFIDYTGEFLNFERIGFWWTSTEYVTQNGFAPVENKGWNIILHKYFKNLYGSFETDYPYPKEAGMSVRCVKDY